MDENTLRKFFLDPTISDVLASEINYSLRQVDKTTTVVQIHKMETDFVVTRDIAAALCTAVINDTLSPQHLTPIAFTLLGSDCFKWDDELIGEVINALAAPEVNYPLTIKNIEAFRDGLLGDKNFRTRLERNGIIADTGLVFKRIAEFI